MEVIKYNGEKQKFNLEKIKKMIRYYCKGLDVNPIELESKISVKFKDGMKTSDIQAVIEHTIISMVDGENPDWAIAGGRSVIYNEYKKIKKNTNLDVNDDFDKHFAYHIENNLYDRTITNFISKEEIKALNKYIKHERDYDLTVASAKILFRKYLAKNKHGVTEYLQHSLMAVAVYLNRLTNSDDRVAEIVDDYEYLSKTTLSLGTPFRTGMRKPNANLSSCFTIESLDTIEDIVKTIRDASLISKSGGGVGIYLGKLRPQFAKLQGLPYSNNITSWVNIFNSLATAVDQLGSRVAAITISIDAWHLDILDFIEIKTEVGELRKKSFDIFPQVIIYDEFIRRKNENLDWYMFDSKEIIDELGFDLTETTNFTRDYNKCIDAVKDGNLKHFKRYSALKLWKKFLTIYIETGDFYLFQRDKVNATNPVYQNGMITKTGNLCTESFSPMKASRYMGMELTERGSYIHEYDLGYSHTCNLASINMTKCIDDGMLEKATRKAVRMLNKAIKLTNTPLPESKKHNEMFGTIGIGTLGMADYMAWKKLSYLKESDFIEVEKVQEQIMYYAYDESCNIAIESGSFKEFDNSYFKDGKLLGKEPEELEARSVANLPWVNLSKKIKSNGLANMLLVAIAPNTSTGALMGVSSSYLPVFSKFFYEEMNKIMVPIPAKFIKDRLWYYQEAPWVPTENIIKLTNKISYWIDTGVSMELVINPNITNIKKISDALSESLLDNIKTVYYCRVLDVDGKGGIIEDVNSKTKSKCISCEN